MSDTALKNGLPLLEMFKRDEMEPSLMEQRNKSAYDALMERIKKSNFHTDDERDRTRALVNLYFFSPQYLPIDRPNQEQEPTERRRVYPNKVISTIGSINLLERNLRIKPEFNEVLDKIRSLSAKFGFLLNDLTPIADTTVEIFQQLNATAGFLSSKVYRELDNIDLTAPSLEIELNRIANLLHCPFDAVKYWEEPGPTIVELGDSIQDLLKAAADRRITNLRTRFKIIDERIQLIDSMDDLLTDEAKITISYAKLYLHNILCRIGHDNNGDVSGRLQILEVALNISSRYPSHAVNARDI